jgi:hypothetical protein
MTIHCRLYGSRIDALKLSGFHVTQCRDWEYRSTSREAYYHKWEWQAGRQPKIWNGRLVVRVWHLLRFTSNYTMKDFLERDSYVEDVVRDIVCAHRQCNHRALVAALHDFVSQNRLGVEAG